MDKNYINNLIEKNELETLLSYLFKDTIKKRKLDKITKWSKLLDKYNSYLQYNKGKKINAKEYRIWENRINMMLFSIQYNFCDGIKEVPSSWYM